MATRKEQLSDDELQAKRKEIIDIIESDPELFLAVAEKNPDGQRILKAIRRADADNAAQSQASIANTSERTVTQAEALDALELLDRTQYRRADRDFSGWQRQPRVRIRKRPDVIADQPGRIRPPASRQRQPGSLCASGQSQHGEKQDAVLSQRCPRLHR